VRLAILADMNGIKPGDGKGGSIKILFNDADPEK
jgi:hypothetical protein